MIRHEATIDEVIEFLNDALDIDQAGMSALVNTRVPCSSDMAAHPSIQVGQRDGEITTGEPAIVYQFGLLGVLNGIFGTDEHGYGPIAAIVREDGLVTEFQRRESDG